MTRTEALDKAAVLLAKRGASSLDVVADSLLSVQNETARACADLAAKQRDQYEDLDWAIGARYQCLDELHGKIRAAFPDAFEPQGGVR